MARFPEWEVKPEGDKPGVMHERAGEPIAMWRVAALYIVEAGNEDRFDELPIWCTAPSSRCARTAERKRTYAPTATTRWIGESMLRLSSQNWSAARSATSARPNRRTAGPLAR